MTEWPDTVIISTESEMSCDDEHKSSCPQQKSENHSTQIGSSPSKQILPSTEITGNYQGMKDIDCTSNHKTILTNSAAYN